MRLQDILLDSDYALELFSQDCIERLESRIITKETKAGALAYYAPCLIRNKEIKLTPEEVVRQLYLDKLINEYHYPISRIQVEYAVHFGRDVKRADIVILYDEKTQKDRLKQDSKAKQEYIVTEVKKPKLEEGIEQLKSYANALGVEIAVWCNGNAEIIYQRENPNTFKEIRTIPKANESLKNVLNQGFKHIDLVKNDVLVRDKISLKDKILLIEDDVLANSGEDAFEEVFKLIFIKLYDELHTYRKDKEKIQKYHILLEENENKQFDSKLQALYEQMSNLEFARYDEDDKVLEKRIQELFKKAKEEWQGIFPNDSRISLTPSHLSVCVSHLEKCKFFNSNLEVIDEAFEYLANKNSKGEKGQYFTPRYVIDMCVKMLNPKKTESMIDSASGSCGFPIHTCFYVWKQIYKEQNREESEMLTAEEKILEAQEYVKKKVFAIDFDPRTVRISKMLNLIAGDGHTNVFKLNSLDYTHWNEQKNIDEATKTFNKNFENLEKNLPKDEQEKDEKSYAKFDFDIIMANPPFAGNIKEYAILQEYDLRYSLNLEKISEKKAQEYNNHLSEIPNFPQALKDPTAIIETQEGYKR